MASMRLSTMSRKRLILGTFFFLMSLSHLTACPETCFCIDAFVTCSDFKFLDMTLLPSATDTLVLTRGDMEEIPPGFLGKAVNIRMLELNAVNARVVRSGAFADLSNLDLFSITSSTFDVVESESFSGLTEVSKFHISDSKFGRVDKHAFANVNNIVDLRIWSSTFDVISDQTFYKISEIISFQLYQNNITLLGSKLFLGASGIDDITLYKNRIQGVSQGAFQNVNDVTSRVVIHANTFVCSCDIAWIWGDPVFKEYLASNECIFPSQTRPEANSFRMADVTVDTLCGTTEGSTHVRDETTGKSNIGDVLISTDDMIKSTNDLFISTSSSRVSTILLSSTSVTSPQMPFSSVSHAQSSPTSSHRSSTMITKISPVSELSSKFSSKDSTFYLSTSSELHEDTSTEYSVNANVHSKDSLTSQTNKSPNTDTNDFTGQLAREGSTEPFLEVSVDIDQNENAGPYSTSDKHMTTSVPDDASTLVVGNLLSIILLCSLSLLLKSAPLQ